jgi:hypothetical protein
LIAPSVILGPTIPEKKTATLRANGDAQGWVAEQRVNRGDLSNMSILDLKLNYQMKKKSFLFVRIYLL